MSGPDPHDLPVPRTSLVGRVQEVSRTIDLVLEGPERLVTLTGVAGCGKTALALKVAADVRDCFCDGVCLVELARISDPSLIAPAVASARGLGEPADGRPQDTLIADLRARELLLVLDNCEHVVDACAAFVDHLLASCAGLRVLATSREPLQIAGERVCRVSPLAVPPPDAELTPDGLKDCPAVVLFLERARAVDARFALTDENAGAVGRICTLLDGIPLAIELAAARVGVLAAAQILERLDDSFRLLVGGSRSGPRRQQTLKAALDWSYELLSEEEQSLFRGLSSFTAGWSLEGAEAVCCGDAGDATDVLHLMSRLVDKSLVLMEEQNGAARYRFLEPVRQYAEQRLAAVGETSAAEARVTAFFVALAEAAEHGLQHPGQDDWLLVLDREFDNIRAVVHRAQGAKDAESVLRIAGSLYWFFWLRHHLREGQTWLETALAEGDRVSSEVRARALMTLAFTCSFLADYPKGRAFAREAIGILESGGSTEHLSGTLLTLGYITFGMGELAEARVLAGRSLDIAAALGSAWLTGQALLLLGQVAREQGELAEATDLIARSLPAFEECGDSWGIAAVTQMLAADEAEDSWRQSALASMRVYRERGDRVALIGALEYLAVRVEAGHPATQVRLIAAAEAARADCATSRPGGESGDVDRCLAEARTQLGETRYAAAWTSGSAAGLDRVVASLVDAGQGPRSAAAAPRRRRSALPGGLTRREGEVVKLVALGCTDGEIAEALVITRGTASLHVHHILQKLELRSRVQIADWALGHGLIDPSQS